MTAIPRTPAAAAAAASSQAAGARASAEAARQAAQRSLAAFVEEDCVAAVRSAAEEIGAADPLVVRAGIADAIRHLAGMPTPRRLIIDLSGSDEPLAAIGSLAEVCDPGTEVIALGQVNDVGLYRSLISNGVGDYLVKPVPAPALVAALTRAGPEPRAAPEPRAGAGAQPGRLIAVVGARGGVGATTVAVNVAWTLAHEQRMRTVLVDFDLFFGTCALALDLQTGHGFRDALERPGRIDSLFMQRAMTRESDQLSVLGTEEALDGPLNIDPTAMASLIELLRRDFQAVVIDFPRFAARTHAGLLSPPSSAVVVSDPSLAGMRDTLRLSSLLKVAAPQAEVTVALSRVGAARAGELGAADFAKGAGTTVGHVIPCDVKALAASAAAGRPVVKVAHRTKAAAALRTLARALATAPAPAPLPLWKRMLKGGR